MILGYHENLKFSPDHINDVLVETWEYLKLSSSTITQEYFKKTHIIPLSLQDKELYHQAGLTATQMSNGQKLYEIELMEKSRVSPIYME